MVGIVTDDLGDTEILLSYSDMKDWGMLAEDFPKVKPMKVKKVSTKEEDKCTCSEEAHPNQVS